MDMKRRIALAAALLAAGLGAGHFVQNRAATERLAAQREAAAVKVRATSVVPLAAESDPAPLASVRPPEAKAAALPAAPMLTPAPAPKPELVALPTPDPAPTVLPDSSAQVEAKACPVTLDLAAQDHAMLGLTLLAPCQPDARVVIKHGGLAITGKTSATGTLFVDLPAMTADGTVTAKLADGTRVEARQPIPEVAGLRRFAVQWLDRDAFQVQAFENGADYGQPGNVSANAPHTPVPGKPLAGGFLTLLGDDSVDLPMLAEVYTFPATGTADVVVEAVVTETTCGRELLGETVASEGGKSATSELTLAMPDCGASGDILVLKNLVPGTKLATR